MALLEETCVGIFSDKEKMIESISEEQHTSNIAYTLVHVTTPFRYASRTFFFKGNSYLQRHPVLNPFITWLSHAHHNQQWLTGCCCLTSPFHIAQLSLRVAVYSSCSPMDGFIMSYDCSLNKAFIHHCISLSLIHHCISFVLRVPTTAKLELEMWSPRGHFRIAHPYGLSIPDGAKAFQLFLNTKSAMQIQTKPTLWAVLSFSGSKLFESVRMQMNCVKLLALHLKQLGGKIADNIQCR